MERYDIYKDIAKRTSGDIYIGVVGPVRTGKSTFVTKFMELMVIPNIQGKNKKQVAIDELPQAGSGKSITTTEPKFIPGDSVNITLKNKQTARVKLIDCVGYLVDGAIGHEEEGKERLVKTPWSEDFMPFSMSAEIGTKKVIEEHSTIGVLVTTDGSISGIERSNYIQAEERVVDELKGLNKPFVVLLNTLDEKGESAKKLSAQLQEKYCVPVLTINLATATVEDMSKVLREVLMQFPIKSIDIKLPKWMQALPRDSEIISSMLDGIMTASEGLDKMSGYDKLEDAFLKLDYINPPSEIQMNAGEGVATYIVTAEDALYYKIISSELGEDIDSDHALMKYIKNLAVAKASYDRFKYSLSMVDANGYGIAEPKIIDTEVYEPKVVKEGGRYAVRVEAKADSVHMIKVGVKSSISPLSGTQKQCQDFVDYLNAETGGDREKLMQANIFGRPLSELIANELSSKVTKMPDLTRAKVIRNVNKMVNENKYRCLWILY